MKNKGSLGQVEYQYVLLDFGSDFVASSQDAKKGTD